MILLEKLKEQGWYLTEDGIKKLINSLQTDDVNKIISAALDWDLKDIAAGALPSKPDANSTITGRIVLQIQKMRNISAPKANEESTTVPRFLQLELSDGANTIAALEFERIASLNLNVPPGTKLFFKAEKLKLLNGFIVLKSSDIQVLGGKVEVLVEKWEVARQMLKYARSNRRLSGSGGPPPWIAFGKRIDGHKDVLPTDKNFKSLQAANEKDKNSKENDEFNASRSQAIAEAAKAGQKKVFGGGQQNILDHNVKKILEKGYSEEDAKQALKITNNNLEKALYNLKRRNTTKSGSIENSTRITSATVGGRVRDRGGVASAKGEASAAKPQTNVSLFDFLTDKLPVTSSSNTVQSQPAINNTNNVRNFKENSSKSFINNRGNEAKNNRFENNMSSSFAANRATTSSKTEEKQIVNPRNNINQKQEERKQQLEYKTSRDVDRNNSNRLQNQAFNKEKTQTSTGHNETTHITSYSSNKRNEKSLKKDRDQIHRNSVSDYQTNKRNNDFKPSEKKSCYSRDTIRNNQDAKTGSNNFQQKETSKLNNFEKTMENFVESTSKLSIQNKKETATISQQNRNRNSQQSTRNNNLHQNTNTVQQLQQRSSNENYTNSAQQPESTQFIDSHQFSSKSFQQNTKSTTYTPQIGNGFSYDPSKIMGFQSKEANEYAMNLLKSQGLSMQQQLQQQQTVASQPHQPITLPPPQQQHLQPQILNNQTATVAYLTPNTNLLVAPQQAASQFGMISSGNWPWKIGDLCLAKYWDDGNYYNAKITAISDKTCVVLYLGYGNHEEVLKSDCLPITDTQHIPLNTYQTNISPPTLPQPAPPPVFQQRSNIHSGSNQRFRGERQMYIPPAKRNNN